LAAATPELLESTAISFHCFYCCLPSSLMLPLRHATPHYHAAAMPLSLLMPLPLLIADFHCAAIAATLMPLRHIVDTTITPTLALR